MLFRRRRVSARAARARLPGRALDSIYWLAAEADDIGAGVTVVVLDGVPVSVGRLSHPPSAKAASARTATRRVSVVFMWTPVL